ncbi:hypothetical protein BC628DRAFT_65127 [Trametes gibbosa]|nr:hypothetical protein BC628DRAFT_65127 [Trametes gibbosa]
MFDSICQFFSTSRSPVPRLAQTALRILDPDHKMSNHRNTNEDNDFAYKTGNYPPTDDTTSEGGYSAPSPFSPHAQRHASPSTAPSTSPHDPSVSRGLIDQSLDGSPLDRSLQDAKQGTDPRAREQYAHDARRDFARAPVSPSAPAGAGAGSEAVNQAAREAALQLAAGYGAADLRGRHPSE